MNDKIDKKSIDKTLKSLEIDKWHSIEDEID